MRTFDALVVGGGPAGASAAHILASGGASTILVERARMPRYKPCGGGLVARSRQASPLAAAYGAETVACRLQLRSADQSLYCELPEPIWMVMRAHFDAYLVEQAAAAGAEVRDGCALVTLERDAGGLLRVGVGPDTVLARYVVGADGANGVTARLSGFPNPGEPAVALEAEMAVPDSVQAPFEATALVDFSTVPGGYAWVFGKRDGLSVGIGKAPLSPGGNMHTMLQTFASSVPGLEQGRTVIKHGYRIPVAGGRTFRRLGNILLAGDAAALADPLTGEGISYALASGRRAGAVILAALAGGPEALDGYDPYLEKVLGGNRVAGMILGRLMYRSPELLFRLLQRYEGARTLLAGGVSGTADYRAVLKRMVIRAPRVVRGWIA